MTGPATPLPVSFDQQIFAMQQRGGISRYFVEVMRRLEADPALGIEPVTPFRSVRNEHLLDVYPDRFVPGEPAGRLRRLFSARTRMRRTGTGGVLHYTYYDDAHLVVGGDQPTVSTVHDMIPELFSEEFGGTNPHLAKRRFVEASTSVICVSDTTRRDLIATYGALAADISVVHLGVGDEFRQPAAASLALPPSFVLYVGHRSGYKDFDVLLAALAQEPGLAGVDLVCIGGSAFTETEQARARELHLAERIHHLRVSDADLPGVYARALALAYPSRYEGFGLPVLEAMAAGCPVVLTDIAIFHETADTAADYFPAGDSAALADRLMRLCNDSGARTDLVGRGRLRAADFTWHRTARAHAEVYRRSVEIVHG